MPSDSENLKQLTDTVESLRREIAILADRVVRLETTVAPAPPAKALTSFPKITVSTDDPAVAEKGLSEEVLLAISAAVAQYLGVQPRTRQISLVGGASWARQGRVTIQASHSLLK